ncbi:hypothetical protein A0H81_02306 [Grifola frondosa]|uniref:Uncharacterized protein n=1 Tax=Grifola frondosa TaxID=5627 RepID=A0A1C7MLL8_GRIFR|nr:hypothetical protein A0H81_02306 [Grifola frondosa]
MDQMESQRRDQRARKDTDLPGSEQDTPISGTVVGSTGVGGVAHRPRCGSPSTAPHKDRETPNIFRQLTIDSTHFRIADKCLNVAGHRTASVPASTLRVRRPVPLLATRPWRNRRDPLRRAPHPLRTQRISKDPKSTLPARRGRSRSFCVCAHMGLPPLRARAASSRENRRRRIARGQ